MLRVPVRRKPQRPRLSRRSKRIERFPARNHSAGLCSANLHGSAGLLGSRAGASLTATWGHSSTAAASSNRNHRNDKEWKDATAGSDGDGVEHADREKIHGGHRSRWQLHV